MNTKIKFKKYFNKHEGGYLMDNELLLEINNLGPINRADLEIGKVNVVVGKNSTGKSTSSKFLFCLLTALSKEGILLANNDIKNRLSEIFFLLQYGFYDNESINNENLSLIEELLQQPSSNELFIEIYDKLKELTGNITSLNSKNIYNNRLKKVKELIKINENRDSQYVRIFNLLLDSEYAYSLNKYNNTKIIFKKDEIIQEIYIKNNFRKGKIHKEFYDILNFENIIYIDSPSILDFIYEEPTPNIRDNFNIINENIPYHLQSLNKKIKNTSNGIYDQDYYKELDVFKTKINQLIGGNFKYDKQKKRFLLETDEDTYQMENTASGLKQLGVIQLLLNNRELTENSFLILDEPEVNLHPDFQIKLAQILILAAKDLNITVYINTHSPFLAEAIEAYSRYYNLLNDTNFYLTEKIDGMDKYNYNLLDNDEIIEIYDNLGNPFDIIHKIKVQADLMNDLRD